MHGVNYSNYTNFVSHVLFCVHESIYETYEKDLNHVNRSVRYISINFLVSTRAYAYVETYEDIPIKYIYVYIHNR
jgi:hypothetical protein